MLLDDSYKGKTIGFGHESELFVTIPKRQQHLLARSLSSVRTPLLYHLLLVSTMNGYAASQQWMFDSDGDLSDEPVEPTKAEATKKRKAVNQRRYYQR